MQRAGGRNRPGMLQLRKKASTGKHPPYKVGRKDLVRAIDHNLDFIFCEMEHHQKISRRKVAGSKFM